MPQHSVVVAILLRAEASRQPLPLSYKRRVPDWWYSHNIPMKNPRSPSLVVTNAFFAASAADGLKYQKPMRRYEARPTNSQQTNNSKRLLAMTKPSMAEANNERNVKKRVKFSSCAMYPME